MTLGPVPGPRPLGLLVVLLLLSSPLSAVIRTFVPVSLKPGALNEVYGWDSALPSFQVELSRSGKVLASAKSFAWPHDGLSPAGLPLRVAAAFVAFDVLTKPGTALVRILDAKGRETSRQSVEIAARRLPEEKIPLTKSMSELRSVPDPRKDREAQQIWGVYLTIVPGNLWTSGRFLLPVREIPFSAAFGDVRTYEYTDGTSASDYHRGTDFAAPVGTPVQAPAGGKVALSADRMLTGGTLVVEHAPGLYSVYFHLSQRLVKTGDQVTPGQRIALSGKTGLVTGPHLHWEVRYNGIPVDALDLVNDGLLDTDRIAGLISSIERKRG